MWCRKCEEKFRAEEQGWADRTHAIIGLVLFMSAFVVLGVLVPWNTLGEVGEPLWIGLLVAFLGSIAVFAWTRWSRRSAFLRR
jgi:divalent metal cation (Fe/Co/Zn/Cd) transporter